jgi:hypothetical protein
MVWAALCVAFLCGSSVRAENLIANGDFEKDTENRPAAGWTVWGDKNASKESALVDSANPHGGKKCLRIHKPANTKQYAVSDPKQAIETKKGQKYTFTFWARTDQPGKPSVFYIEALKSLTPMVDASSPGRFPVEAAAEWKQFSFSIAEGSDFKADEQKYIMLAFRPSMDKGVDQSLWIDDVEASAGQADAAEAGLIDEATLKYEPLNHRLKPGDAFTLTVHADKRLHPLHKTVAGVSFHRICGYGRHPYDRDGKYVLPKACLDSLAEMKLPMTRFYAVGAESFGVNTALDRIADLLTKINIPHATTVLELEPQGAEEKYAPEKWAEAVTYALGKGYKFQNWEISNEPYTRKAVAFKGPDDYAEHVKAVGAAIRKVQPDAKIGLEIGHGSLAWGNRLLKKAAGSYDWVAGHFYAEPPQHLDMHTASTEYSALTVNYEKLDRVLQVSALMKAYNPGKDVYHYDTEWGLCGPGKKGEEECPRNSNICGTLHRAVRLIYYAREDLMRGASSWEMFSSPKAPTFMVLSCHKPDQRGMQYWLYHQFNRHVGEQVVEIEGTAPYYTPTAQEDPDGKAAKFAGPITPALASVSENNSELYLVIANASWTKDFPVDATLTGFAAAKATGTLLTHGNLDAEPLVSSREEVLKDLPVEIAGKGIKFQLPAHSVAFIAVERK